MVYLFCMITNQYLNQSDNIMKNKLRDYVNAFCIVSQMPHGPRKIDAIHSFFESLNRFDFGRDFERLLRIQDGTKHTFIFTGHGYDIHLETVIEDGAQILTVKKSVFPD